MTKRRFIVGGSLDEAAQRVADAWHRADRSETVEPEDNVTFPLELGEDAETADELFAQMVEIVREGGAIIRTEKGLSRTFEVRSPDDPSDDG